MNIAPYLYLLQSLNIETAPIHLNVNHIFSFLSTLNEMLFSASCRKHTEIPLIYCETTFLSSHTTVSYNSALVVYRRAKHSPDFHKSIFNKEGIF